MRDRDLARLLKETEDELDRVIPGDDPNGEIALLLFYMVRFEVIDRMAALEQATRERDDARNQLQAIGRKAFWAAR